jgi:hypothetical protein
MIKRENAANCTEPPHFFYQLAYFTYRAAPTYEGK